MFVSNYCAVQNFPSDTAHAWFSLCINDCWEQCVKNNHKLVCKALSQGLDHLSRPFISEFVLILWHCLGQTASWKSWDWPLTQLSIGDQVTQNSFLMHLGSVRQSIAYLKEKDNFQIQQHPTFHWPTNYLSMEFAEVLLFTCRTGLTSIYSQCFPPTTGTELPNSLLQRQSA